jgi:hypothetical protein
MALLLVLTIGIYTHLSFQITPSVPFPSAVAGVAGLALLWRRRDRITPMGLSAFLAVILVYLVASLLAPDPSFLAKRSTGLLQLIYSLSAAYGLLLTMAVADSRQIARLYLWFCLIIAGGCLLETYGGLRPISDAVRHRIYNTGVYNADIRDMILYGRVRPKFFASEPAAVTFTYSICCFVWLAVSGWRWKILGYGVLVALGMVSMPGPTLLLMLLLLVPYELSLAATDNSASARTIGLVKFCLFTVLLIVGAAYLGSAVYAERVHHLAMGDDPSFFYRVLGPALAAQYVIGHYPIAGTGLTGEMVAYQGIMNAFAQSPAFSPAWDVGPSSEALSNYFWLHWINLGLVCGLLAMAVLSIWLRTAGVGHLAFCWLVWAIMGQASGAYVGPATWVVLAWAGGCSILHRRRLGVGAETGSAGAAYPLTALQRDHG